MLLSPTTLARLESLVRLARRVTPPKRRRRVLKQRGRGIEIGSRRDYSPGDDLRLIDWPAFARLDRLLLKVQEELPAARLELLLDGSASMARGTPCPHERACLAAAAVAAGAVARGVRVVVWWGGAPIERLELRRPGELVRLVTFLAQRQPAGVGQLEASALRIAATTRGRGGALLLSDGLDEDTVRAARRLKSHGFDTLVTWVGLANELPAAEALAGSVAGLVELVDAESAETRRQAFSPLSLAEAAARRAERMRQLSSKLAELGVTQQPLPAPAPFEAVALALMRG